MLDFINSYWVALVLIGIFLAAIVGFIYGLKKKSKLLTTLSGIIGIFVFLFMGYTAIMVILIHSVMD